MEKENIPSSMIVTCIVLLIALVFCIYVITDQDQKLKDYANEDRQTQGVPTDIEKDTNTGGSDSIHNSSTYQNFVQNMKEARNTYRYENGDTQYETVELTNGNDSYSVYLDQNGNLYFDFGDTLKETFSIQENPYLGLTNVLSFYVIEVGSSKYDEIYAILENGTVTRIAIEGAMEDKKILVEENYGNKKEIVAVLPGLTENSPSPRFLDVYGNLTK